MSWRHLADLPPDVVAAMREVTFLLLDVDGIQTDGRLPFDGEGRECKTFHVHDGAGVVYWRRSGYAVGFLSGRDSAAVRARAAELQVDELHLGSGRKLDVLDDICARRGLRPAEVCYMGDDLLDLPVLRRVGVPITVPQARPELFGHCCYVTRAAAGDGAVREVVELLLEAKGRFAEILARCGMKAQEPE